MYYIINIVHVHLSGSVVILSLEVQKMYLNKAVTSQILNHKKCNWQRASARLATWTASVEGHRAGPRVLLHALHY